MYDVVEEPEYAEVTVVVLPGAFEGDPVNADEGTLTTTVVGWLGSDGEIVYEVVEEPEYGEVIVVVLPRAFALNGRKTISVPVDAPDVG